VQVLGTDGQALFLNSTSSPQIKSGGEAPLFLSEETGAPSIEVPVEAEAPVTPPVGGAIYVSFSSSPPPKPGLRDVLKNPPTLFRGQKLLVIDDEERKERAQPRSFSDPVAELLTDGDRPWFARGMNLFSPNGKG
jgi:hypothetical protein